MYSSSLTSTALYLYPEIRLLDKKQNRLLVGVDLVKWALSNDHLETALICQGRKVKGPQGNVFPYYISKSNSFS